MIQQKNKHIWGWGDSTDSSLTSKVGSRPEPCEYCGNIHNGLCSRIKRIEYFPDGTIKSIELNDRNNNFQNFHG